MKLYIASSWRNAIQPEVVDELRLDGHDVYDFRNPSGGKGFSWQQVKPPGALEGIPAKGADLEHVDDYLRMIEHPVAQAGYRSDYSAMTDADAIIMVLPCGKSAHLELGWGIGAGKRTAILLEDPIEPELMYLGVDFLARSIDELSNWLRGIRNGGRQ